MAQYDPESYRIYLKISIENSQHKHILVEGKDDKYLVERLWQDYRAKNGQETNLEVIVDSAEYLIKGNESQLFANNREKVESIADSIRDKPYAGGFVGLVDREFHQFEWDCTLSDRLLDLTESHEVEERLVRSRGHSIENYIFDFSTLSDALQCLSTTVYTNQAIELFKATFKPTLCIACALGLAATKAELLSKTNSTIDRDLLEINAAKEIEFKLNNWIDKLTARGISDSQKQDIEVYYGIYSEQVSRSSPTLIRWLCHGHIGYDFLKALYQRCIIEVCLNVEDQTKELSGITWAKKEKLFYSFINCWVKKSLESQCEYPQAIFELLGIVS